MKCFSKIRDELDARCSILDSSRRSVPEQDEYRVSSIKYTNKAFTLIEVMTALAILALVSSSVLVVINHCVTSASDTALRMQAFELARENMEKLLASDSVQETVEYGESDKYPGIKWQTSVETFDEPITARMWIRAICSAEYSDSAGQTQTIELTHWLTDVTKEQLLEMLAEEGKEQEGIADQVIKTIEEAAEYAGVDTETIQQWIKNGMLTIENGYFVKYNLDLYKKTDGKPSAESKNKQISNIGQLMELKNEKAEPNEQKTPGQQKQPGKVEFVTGLKYEELEKMDVSEIYNLLKDKKRKKL
jgi:prepilin-type N-terminal cleavage/methylation domain-containing protein